ncbi:MAG: hypothetical protein ACTJHW_10425 [Paenalcaligenes sp.]
MTQIQALENMSQPKVVALYQELLQRYDDDIATLSTELASRQTTINEALSFIRCDASAATYQSLGQYRTAIIKILSNNITEV